MCVGGVTSCFISKQNPSLKKLKLNLVHNWGQQRRKEALTLETRSRRVKLRASEQMKLYLPGPPLLPPSCPPRSGFSAIRMPPRVWSLISLLYCKTLLPWPLLNKVCLTLLKKQAGTETSRAWQCVPVIPAHRG